MKTLLSILLLISFNAAATNCSTSPGDEASRGEVNIKNVTTCDNGMVTIVYSNGTVKIVSPDHVVQELRVDNSITVRKP